jgi:hypothetical protein
MGLPRPDVGRPDHVAPFLCFIGDELAELGGRARKHGAAQFGEARFQLGIGEGGVDFPVELVDDLSRRIPRRANAIPPVCFEGRQDEGAACTNSTPDAAVGRTGGESATALAPRA